MAKIVGSFYLRKTDSGNLLGEFTNNVRFTVSTENANLKQAGNLPYVGRYLSTWLEGDVPHTAELIIEHLENADALEKRYKLVWNDFEKGAVYEAEALLAEDVLVGHYLALS